MRIVQKIMYICLLVTIVYALGLCVVSFVFNWIHPEYTRMMLFQKYFIHYVIIIGGGVTTYFLSKV
jgi:hypothetical protein